MANQAGRERTHRAVICVRALVAILLSSNVTLVAGESHLDTDRPGDYRLLRGGDNAVCTSFSNLLATSRSRTGDIDLSKYPDRLKWVSPAPGSVHDISTWLAEIDFEGDGVIDRIYLTSGLQSNHYTDSLVIQRGSIGLEPIPVTSQSIVQALKYGKRVDLASG
jgi:hypothetical protein